MFHWICPECGREIAPTIRECPVCDPIADAVETAPAGEVEASARAEKPASESPESVIAPIPQITLTSQPSQLLLPAAVPVITAEPIDGAPAELALQIRSKSPRAARSSRSVGKQSSGEDALLPHFGPASPDGDPLEHLTLILDSRGDAGAPEPPPSHDALPLTMRAAPNVPPSLRAFIAELRPAGGAPSIPFSPVQRSQRSPAPPQLMNPMPLRLRASVQPPAAPTGAKLLTLPAKPSEAIRPSTPPWEPAPPLAPLGNYSPLAGRPLRPAVPTVRLLQKECGPRTTLPGPMLTRRLVKFLDRELNSIPPELLRVKKRLIPGWMATALILGTLLGAGFTSVFSVVRPAADASSTATPQTKGSVSIAPGGPDGSSAGAAPLANAIEVTGFRIQADPSKKSEIQYLVVNHTPARFSGVTVYVTLYAADAKAGQPALCRFQFKAPNLAPFQAKDMSSTIERIAHPVSLPDWQDLRASVEVGE